MTNRRRWLDWEPTRAAAPASTLESTDKTDGSAVPGNSVGFVSGFVAERSQVSAAVRIVTSAGGEVRLVEGELEVTPPVEPAQEAQDALLVLTRSRLTAIRLFRALECAKHAGVKLAVVEQGLRVAQVPRSRDRPEVRQALRDLGLGRLPVRLAD